MSLLSRKTISVLIRKFFILGILLFSIINVKLPMFTFVANSGYIYVYASEIIIFLIILLFVYKVTWKKYILDHKEKKLFYLIILFLIIYVVLTVIRYFLNYNFKDSIFALKVSVFPIFLFYMPRFLNLKKDDIIMNLVVFSLIINCLQIQYFENVRFSMLLENIMIYLTISISLIGINFYTLFNMKKSKFLYIKYCILIFNIIFSMICVFFAGSRISMFVLVLLIALVIIYYLFLNWKYAVIVFALFITSFLLSIIIPMYNKNVTSNLNRVISFIRYSNDIKTNEFEQPVENLNESVIPNLTEVTHSNVNSLPLDNNDVNNSLTDNGNYSDAKYDDDFVVNERIKSDNIRKYLVKCAINTIKRNPIIGYGTYTFRYDDGGGVKYQSAHNFILEYLCLYGVIGTFVYFLIALDLFKDYISFNFDYIKYFVFVSVVSILIHSLVQPTMLNVVVVYTFWSLLSISYFNKSDI